MDKLEKTFHACFGIPIPKKLLPQDIKKNLVPLGKRPGGTFLFGSPIAAQRQYLVQADLREFIESCPKGYFLIGFWGHGANSYAFHFSRVDSWSKILFRLPYGGIYMDNTRMSKKIRAFLLNYLRFEARIRNKVESIIFIDSMQEGYYRLVLPGRELLEIKESFLETANFEERLLI